MSRLSILRWAAYGLELFVLFILQETPGLFPLIWGQKGLLLVPAALSIALFENNLPAMSLGILAGLLLDFGMGYSLGFHAMILAILCFFISEMGQNLIRTNFLTALLTGVLGSTVLLFLQWLVYCVVAGSDSSLYILTHHYAPRLLCTVLPIPVAYYFNRVLWLFIRERE